MENVRQAFVADLSKAGAMRVADEHHIGCDILELGFQQLFRRGHQVKAIKQASRPGVRQMKGAVG